MSKDQEEGLTAELVRWGLRAQALSAEAERREQELEGYLLKAREVVDHALARVRTAGTHLDPSDEQVRRIEEVGRASADAASRTDLLALNVQVEAARLGEDDRDLERVAHEIRGLSDRGSRAAAEVDELATTLRAELARLREAWTRSGGELAEARDLLLRALKAAEETGQALAEARGVSGQFSAGAAAHSQRKRPWSLADAEAATRLAAAAEVRGGTIQRLARAVSRRLRETGEQLVGDARRADEAARLVEGYEARLHRLDQLVLGADEISRRAKQLAINADLAATHSDDPAFGLFAEEARRLSERAEAVAEAAESRLLTARSGHSPAVEACRKVAGSIRSVASDLVGLLERFTGEETPSADEADEDLGHVWRDDRAAARQLAEARADWHHQDPAAAAPEEEAQPED